ncbi:MAG: serine/threonine protein kinase, partial [Victivallales bacterium]|nr:serine/threonine protein kinase [Victivallales bacterium]
MEDQDEQLDNHGADSFYASEMKRLGLDIEIAEPHLNAIDKLGQGGSGEVTESYDEILGRTVAVKTLHDDLKEHPKLVERMIREAQAAAQLEHPNIVPIYALGVSPTKGVYFTMKRLRGDSLRHIITQLALKNPAYTWEYTPSRRLSIFIRICQGVSYAHSKGILHRDLKPENIRIGNYGEVTIIDWGLVREMIRKPGSNEHGKDKHNKEPKDKHRKPGFTVTEYNLASKIIADSNPTIDGELSGTPRYMSPEQADAHNSELDKRSDIYSLGVILYELLTCFNPFYDKKDETAIIDAVMHGNYLRPRQFDSARNVPVELEAICLKALELNKEMRYQTVDDLLRDIYAHQEGRQVQAYKGNFFTNTHKLLKRNPIRSTILISGLLSVFLFMGITHFIRSSQYGNVLRQVKTALDEAYSMQELMQNQLDSKAGTLDMSSPTIKGLQANIDNQLDTATRLLSSIPASHAMVHHYREQILLHRLRHDARNMRIDEINKDINLVSEFFGNDTLDYSPELSEAIHIAKDALYGVCNISSLDTMPYKSEVRIQSLRIDDNGLFHGNGFLPLRDFASKENVQDA